MLRSTLIAFPFLLCMTFTGIAQISPKKLIKEHRKAMKGYMDGMIKDANFQATANAQAEIGEFNMSVKIYLKHTGFRMEMELMGAKFIQVSSDSISYSYNPLDNAYEFEQSSEGDESAFGLNTNYALIDLLDEGYEIVSVEQSRLDSLDVYLVDLSTRASANETYRDVKTVYIDKSTFFLTGKKWTGTEEYYFDHQDIGGELIPMMLIDKTQGADGMILKIEDFNFNVDLNDSLFQMTPEALEAYRDSKESDSQAKSAIQLLNERGDSLRGTGKNKEAIEVYSQSLELKPNQYSVLNARGLAKTFSEDHYGAIADITRAIELKGTDTGVLYNNLGLAKYHLGDYNAARGDYDKALAMDTTNSSFYSNYGLLMFQFEDYEGVVENFSKALALNSDNQSGYYYRAIAQAELENYVEALADYATVERMGVELGEFSNYKGISFYNLGRYDSAKVAFHRAAELEPDEVQYWKNLADTYDELEEYHEAIAVYDQLVTADSTLYDVYAERALSYHSLSLNLAAKRDIDKAIELSPESAIYYDYRAYIKEDLGDYSGAVEDFTISLNLEQDPNIYYRRGLAKINLNNKNEACIDFKKGAELGSDEAKEAMGEHCKLK